MMRNFIQSHSKINQTLQEGFKQYEENFKRIDASLDQLATQSKMLENQIASQASSSNFWQIGKFPIQIENLKEHVNAVTLRSGKQLPEVKHKIEESKAEPNQVPKEVEKLRSNELDQEPKKTKIPFFPFPQRMGNGALDKQF